MLPHFWEEQNIVPLCMQETTTTPLLVFSNWLSTEKSHLSGFHFSQASDLTLVIQHLTGIARGECSPVQSTYPGASQSPQMCDIVHEVSLVSAVLLPLLMPHLSVNCAEKMGAEEERKPSKTHTVRITTGCVRSVPLHSAYSHPTCGNK